MYGDGVFALLLMSPLHPKPLYPDPLNFKRLFPDPHASAFEADLVLGNPFDALGKEAVFLFLDAFGQGFRSVVVLYGYAGLCHNCAGIDMLVAEMHGAARDAAALVQHGAMYAHAVHAGTAKRR